MKTFTLLTLVVLLLVLAGNKLSLAQGLQDTADYMSLMSEITFEQDIEGRCTKASTGTMDVRCRDKILAEFGMSYITWFIHLQTYAVNIDSFNRRTTKKGSVIYTLKKPDELK